MTVPIDPGYPRPLDQSTMTREKDIEQTVRLILDVYDRVDQDRNVVRQVLVDELNEHVENETREQVGITDPDELLALIDQSNVTLEVALNTIAAEVDGPVVHLTRFDSDELGGIPETVIVETVCNAVEDLIEEHRTNPDTVSEPPGDAQSGSVGSEGDSTTGQGNTEPGETQRLTAGDGGEPKHTRASPGSREEQILRLLHQVPKDEWVTAKELAERFPDPSGPDRWDKNIASSSLSNLANRRNLPGLKRRKREEADGHPFEYRGLGDTEGQETPAIQRITGDWTGDDPSETENGENEDEHDAE